MMVSKMVLHRVVFLPRTLMFVSAEPVSVVTTQLDTGQGGALFRLSLLMPYSNHLINILLSTLLLRLIPEILQFALSSWPASGGCKGKKVLFSTRIRPKLNMVAGGYNSSISKLPKMPI